MKHSELISKLSLDDKIALLSGKGFYTTKENDKINLPSITFADGPLGVRKVDEDPDSAMKLTGEKSICYPSTSLIASSWDCDLVEEMGKTIGEDCLGKKVGVLLGPGMNIKRSPYCGRNFEYFSEDPLLSGELAGSFVKGVQSNGISTCIKHFAANNQETRRMTVDSVVDERTLRELYLKNFEIAIKKGNPDAVMCAYNRLNGTYCCENNTLLTDILRKEWGYNGLVMSDWGATNIRPDGIKAGLDLEMPGDGSMSYPDITKALEEKTLEEKDIDECLDRVLDLLLKTAENLKKEVKVDEKVHVELATKFAEESAILLLNNEKVLPIKKDVKVLLLGELAVKPRYQGNGSSVMNPTECKTLCEEFDEIGLPYDYKQGYKLSDEKPNKTLIQECVKVALQYPKIVICCGLPPSKETEGLDRETLSMPENQIQLIYELAKYNKNIIVLLYAGAPVTMPWIDFVQSVLLMYLPGQMGSKAAVKILTGDVNPSGKLAESFPLYDNDVPCYLYSPGDIKRALYREGLFVGYRYYDTAKIPVLFPFGYGLSYSTFEYKDLKLSSEEINDNDKLQVEVTVENTSDVDGKEVVQLYVSFDKSTLYTPLKELKAFKKVLIKAKSSEIIKFELDKSAFEVYDVESKSWVVESGSYTILVGKNSADLPLIKKIKVTSTKEVKLVDLKADCPWYFEPKPEEIPLEQFNKLYGKEIDTIIEIPVKGYFTLDNTVEEMSGQSMAIRMFVKGIKAGLAAKLKVGLNNPSLIMMTEIIKTTPLKNLPRASMGSMKKEQAEAILSMGNGQVYAGMKSLF